jgi:hypothetical protein
MTTGCLGCLGSLGSEHLFPFWQVFFQNLIHVAMGGQKQGRATSTSIVKLLLVISLPRLRNVKPVVVSPKLKGSPWRDAELIMRWAGKRHCLFEHLSFEQFFGGFLHKSSTFLNYVSRLCRLFFHNRFNRSVVFPNNNDS